jgi:hypothetical protein
MFSLTRPSLARACGMKLVARQPDVVFNRDFRSVLLCQLRQSVKPFFNVSQYPTNG